MRRSSGILLHITSLPGSHGIGDLGEWPCKWLDFLAAGKQRYWQILPLGPVGFGNSPYSSFSAFAGNPLLISLDELVKEQLLAPADIAPYEGAPNKVLFEKVKAFKQVHLLKAFKNFEGAAAWKNDFEQFCAASPWLETFTAFMAKKENCDPLFIKFEQFIFDRQMARVKAYAVKKGVELIGDLPMYVAGDSADRQEHPELFDLETGFTAGTPPSHAFPLGQQWGNPLYKWEKHRETGYQWWIKRIERMLQQVDLVRLDYFCGYAFYWAHNGRNGHWRKGPEADLFEKTRQALKRLPFIAEDLGELTPEVRELRNRFSLPGMKILHYAFDGNPSNPYLPENFETTNCLVYTGTHDNNTTKGWFQSAPQYVQENAKHALNCDGRDITWDMMKYAARTKADLLILPYQDVLCLGADCRFNTPGTVSVNNWAWCMQPAQMDGKIAEALAWLTTSNGRG
jgi:4-alpha-glucanotransferase